MELFTIKKSSIHAALIGFRREYWIYYFSAGSGT